MNLFGYFANKYQSMKITILLSALLFSFLSVFAQYEGMTFHNLTTSMGLSHGDVTCFCQDYEGFMWIGTADGLNKYDGVEFTVYKNELKDSTFSSNSYINCIYEDKQNNLWIGLSDCLIRYNRDKNNFERIPIIDIHGNKIENSVTEIFEDNNNNLWIGCSFGIFLFDREKKQFTEFFADSFDLNSLLECSSICQDKN
jgi:ligand-binding sensor domain-containing protein